MFDCSRPSTWLPDYKVTDEEGGRTVHQYLFLAGLEHPHGDEVGDDGGEGGSDGKEEPAVSLPEFTEAGGLSEDIRDVGGAVGYVRYDRQQESTQSEIKREYRPGRGISGCEVDGHDGCERQVVDEAPTFPEFDGVGDVVPQG